MKDMFDLFERFNQIDWSKRNGVVAGTFINVGFVITLATILPVIGQKLSPKTYAFILLVIEVFVLFVWVFMRYVRVFDSRVMAVGLSFNADAETSLLFNKLSKSFIQQIEAQGLEKIVKTRHLPTDLNFKTDKDAENYLENKGLRVLVWGDTNTGTVNGKKVSEFRIRVTSQNNPMNGVNQKIFTNNLAQGSKRGIWTIQHDNSLDGLAVVSGNILEISLYTLALCLMTVPIIEYALQGTTLLESLKQKISTLTVSSNFPNLDEVKAQIDEILLQQYRSLSNYYFMDKKVLSVALEWAQKAIDIKPKDYDANIQIARLKWEEGDHGAAINYTHRAASINPSESLHHLNYAFFNLCDGKYSNALSQYKKINYRVFRTNVIDVVDFLQREHDKTNLPQLMFASGWVSIKYGDKTLGIKLLNQFIDIAKDNIDFRILVRESSKQLKRHRAEV